jgi:hypothetical protein
MSRKCAQGSFVHLQYQASWRHEDSQRRTDREARLVEPAPLKAQKRHARLGSRARGGVVRVIAFHRGVVVADGAVPEFG